MICYVFHQCNLEKPCFTYALETFTRFLSALPHFFFLLLICISSFDVIWRMKLKFITRPEDLLLNTNEPIDSNSVVQLKSYNTCLLFEHTGFYFIFYVKSSVTSLFIWSCNGFRCPIEATWVRHRYFCTVFGLLVHNDETTFTQATTHVVPVTCFVLKNVKVRIWAAEGFWICLKVVSSVCRCSLFLMNTYGVHQGF